MPISFGPFLYNTRALQILHERVLFLTNFVQRYELSLTLPNISISFYTIGTVPTVYFLFVCKDTKFIREFQIIPRYSSQTAQRVLKHLHPFEPYRSLFNSQNRVDYGLV